MPTPPTMKSILLIFLIKKVLLHSLLITEKL